ncbi:hypothetical protein HPB47_001804, partial [Ixodes persulcatus]
MATDCIILVGPSQDTRLREAGAEVVCCLTRGAPKGPNLPRVRLNHQDALFPGHGLATHSQTPAELTAERLAGEAVRRSWYRGILLALETVAFRRTHAPRRSASAVSGESQTLPASGPRRQLPDAATPPSRSTRTTLSADDAVGTDLSAAPSHLRPKPRSGGAESLLPRMPRAAAQAIRPFGPALPAVSPDSLVHSLENKLRGATRTIYSEYSLAAIAVCAN